MFINHYTKSKPLFIHANAKLDYNIWRQAIFCCRTQFSHLPDTTIFVWNSKATITPMEKRLKELKTPFTKLGEEIDKNWTHHKRIKLLTTAIKSVTTKFILCTDGFDVIVRSFDGLIPFFNSYQCSLLFAAEVNDYPKIDYLKAFDVLVEQSKYKHLNAGCWFGKTEVAAEFFNQCSEIGPLHKQDDQGVVRLVYQRNYPKVKIDSGCKIFQCLYNVPENEVEINSELLRI